MSASWITACKNDAINELIYRKCIKIQRILNLCPLYVSANATRRCTASGTWWIHPEFNESWTNLSLCSPQKKQEGDYVIPEVIAVSSPFIPFY